MPERIRKSIGLLVKRLNAAAVVDELVERHVLDANELAEIDEAIVEKGVVSGGNGVLLRKLMLKAPEDVDVFFSCLRTHQADLGREIEFQLTQEAGKQSHLAHGSHNLPSPDRFWTGREDGITSTVDHVMTRKHPVISVIGPAGFGKTSFAVQIGHRLVFDHNVDVVYVSLRGVSELHEMDKLLYHNLQRVLYPKTSCSLPLVDLIKELKKPVVLILDDVDASYHKVYRIRAYNGFSRLIHEVIEASSYTRVLTTSQCPMSNLHASQLNVSCQELSLTDACSLMNTMCPFLPAEERVAMMYCSGRSPLAIRLIASLVSQHRNNPLDLVSRLTKKGCLPVGAVSSRCLHTCLEAVLEQLQPELVDAFLVFSVFPGPFDLGAARAVLDVPEMRNADLKLSILQPLVSHGLLLFDSSTQLYSLNSFAAEYAGKKFARETGIDEILGAEQRFFLHYINVFLDLDREAREDTGSFVRFQSECLSSSLNWTQMGSVCSKMALHRDIAKPILQLGTSSLLRITTHVGNDLEVKVLHACRTALNHLERKEKMAALVRLSHCLVRRCCIGGLKEALSDERCSTLEGLLDEAVAALRTLDENINGVSVAVSLLCDLLYLKSLIRVASDDLSGAQKACQELLHSLTEHTIDSGGNGNSVAAVCHLLLQLWSNLVLKKWPAVLDSMKQVMQLMQELSTDVSHFHRMALTQKFLTCACAALVQSSYASTNGTGKITAASLVSLAKAANSWNDYVQQEISKRMKKDSQSAYTARDVLAFQPSRRAFQDTPLRSLWNMMKSSLAADDIIETLISFIPSADGAFMRFMAPSTNHFCAVFLARSVLPEAHPAVLYDLATKVFSSSRWRMADDESQYTQQLNDAIEKMSALEQRAYACYALGLPPAMPALEWCKPLKEMSDRCMESCPSVISILGVPFVLFTPSLCIPGRSILACLLLYIDELSKASSAKLAVVEEMCHAFRIAKACASCYADNVSLPCNLCMKIAYCSRQCRHKHRSTHKAICTALRGIDVSIVKPMKAQMGLM